MDHMSYEIDRQPTVEPSLLEMAQKSTQTHADEGGDKGAGTDEGADKGPGTRDGDEGADKGAARRMRAGTRAGTCGVRH